MVDDFSPAGVNPSNPINYDRYSSAGLFQRVNHECLYEVVRDAFIGGLEFCERCWRLPGGWFAANQRELGWVETSL